MFHMVPVLLLNWNFPKLSANNICKTAQMDHDLTSGQCDQMARLHVQYLAIYDNLFGIVRSQFLQILINPSINGKRLFYSGQILHKFGHTALRRCEKYLPKFRYLRTRLGRTFWDSKFGRRGPHALKWIAEKLDKLCFKTLQ